MSRLIDADVLKSHYSWWGGEDQEVFDVIVDQQPTVDTVRHGRWMESDTDGFVCSECRNGYRNQPTLMGKPMFEWCPVCGAKMDGGDPDGT